MHLQIFKSATVKLTLVYIAILICICAFFSFNWYRFATNELNSALRRQSALIERLPNIEETDVLRSVLEAREDRLVEGKRNIARQLLGVNILLLVLGGTGSYFMAKRSLEPIELAHKAQARFTADASHELRTPLAAMQTEIEVALRDSNLTKQAAIGMLKSNLEEVSRLQSLSDGLLRLARQDGGSVTLMPVALQSIFAAVQDRTAKYAQQQGRSITFDQTAATVLADKVSITELLVNLVDNAIKYGRPDGKVRVTVAADQATVQISVVDDGIGMAESELHKIFDRFYRVDSSRSSQVRPGHGLGLSIAQNIAALHGTQITVASKIAVGSTFSFLLQRAAKT